MVLIIARLQAADLAQLLARHVQLVEHALLRIHVHDRVIDLHLGVPPRLDATDNRQRVVVADGDYAGQGARIDFQFPREDGEPARHDGRHRHRGLCPRNRRRDRGSAAR